MPFIFSEFGCNLGVFKTKCPYPGGATNGEDVVFMARLAQMVEPGPM